jgi:hypothetical protein
VKKNNEKDLAKKLKAGFWVKGNPVILLGGRN